MTNRRALMLVAVRELLSMRALNAGRQRRRSSNIRAKRNGDHGASLGSSGRSGFTVHESDECVFDDLDDLDRAVVPLIALEAANRVSTDPSWRRVMATRMALAGQAGLLEMPAGEIDSLWIVYSRTILADRELGAVITAANNIGAGEFSQADLERELDRILSTRKPAPLAKLADDRWQRLARLGWRNTRRHPNAGSNDGPTSKRGDVN